jgi:hypothetical protein
VKARNIVRAGVATQRGDLHGARDVYGAACTIDGRAKAATREAMATGLLARCKFGGMRGCGRDAGG